MGTKRIAVIPGDGIGVDVAREAMAVLETLREVTSVDLEIQVFVFDFGAERYLASGVSLPDGTHEIPKELGGSLGTRAVGSAVCRRIREAAEDVTDRSHGDEPRDRRLGL